VRGRFFRPGHTVVRPWYERNRERFSADRALVAEHYPSLQFRVDSEKQNVSLEGSVIIRECGMPAEIATAVRFPWDYPGHEPVAYDAALRFQPKQGGKLVDRHLGPDGHCCLWLDPESRWNSRDHSALRLFLDELAVFFDRQLIYDLTGEWPGPSYRHGRDGYLEFIREQLGSDAALTETLIGLITMEIRIGPNDICTCGSGKKFKKCHREVVEKIQGKIGAGRVRRILVG
jgi:hypothetical protein